MDIKGIENIRSHKPIRGWDAIALVLFVALLIVLIVILCMPKGETVEVYLDGKLKYRLTLEDKGEYKVDDLLTLVIDDKGVMVKDAVCKDKLCEKQGHINTKGASIVCLPSKITVVIRGTDDKVVVG